MKKAIKAAALLLAFFVLSGVCSCGEGTSEKEESPKSASEIITERGKETESESSNAESRTEGTGESFPESTEVILSPEPVPDPVPDFSELNIRSAPWENVEFEYYTSTYFTLLIPKGWNVQWRGDANQMQWMAVSPDNTVGMSNLDHAYACKDQRMQDVLGFSISLENGTVQEYFEAMFRDSTEYFEVKYSCVPDNIGLISQARPYSTIKDYEALYAVFKDANVEGEGIYSAVIMDSQDVWFNNMNYGAWEINCIVTQWAPVGEFVNWAPVLSEIAGSFTYTDYYISQWQSIAQSALTPSYEMSDTDPVMEAFEERSASDTIIQEKRSDMIGEYERVYDSESGNIYKAYNGFLDDIGDQNRFSPITDNQYTEGYVGWIDKD